MLNSCLVCTGMNPNPEHTASCKTSLLLVQGGCCSPELTFGLSGEHAESVGDDMLGNVHPFIRTEFLPWCVLLSLFLWVAPRLEMIWLCRQKLGVKPWLQHKAG